MEKVETENLERAEILKEMTSERFAMQRSLKRLAELQERLDRCDMEEWDWIPVATAAKLISVSPQSIYLRVSLGKMKARYFLSKMFISKKELLSVNDK